MKARKTPFGHVDFSQIVAFEVRRYDSYEPASWRFQAALTVTGLGYLSFAASQNEKSRQFNDRVFPGLDRPLGAGDQSRGLRHQVALRTPMKRPGI